MDYYKKNSEIIADYNREKDRVTIEEPFAKLLDLADSLDAEQRRTAEEGLTQDELALFDLLNKPAMSKAARERQHFRGKPHKKDRKPGCPGPRALHDRSDRYCTLVVLYAL
jgi:hypothetical protein